MKHTDDIIKMARLAGAHDNGWEVRFVEPEYLERFAALVRADEREKIAEEIFDMCKEGWWDSEGMRHHWSKRGQA